MKKGSIMMTALIIFVVIIAAILAIASTKPNTFSIQRSINIKASPEKIFPLVNDFHNWAAWSPWEHLDPNMKKTFSGTDSGKGAIYEWEGKGKAGAGRMEIAETITPNKMSIKLDFIKPFEGHSMTDFTLIANADSTTTFTWIMYGPNQFMSKVMSVFCSMDKMIGKDFEKGLASLKAEAEK